MLSHVHIGVTDFPRALAFYTAVMDALGFRSNSSSRKNPWAAWKHPAADRPLFLIGHAYDGTPATPGNGQMVALLAPSRDAVDRCCAAALAAGGRSEGSPGLRPEYHPDYYGTYVRDPDGNKLCICCHDPVPAGSTAV